MILKLSLHGDGPANTDWAFDQLGKRALLYTVHYTLSLSYFYYYYYYKIHSTEYHTTNLSSFMLDNVGSPAITNMSDIVRACLSQNGEEQLWPTTTKYFQVSPVFKAVNFSFIIIVGVERNCQETHQPTKTCWKERLTDPA